MSLRQTLRKAAGLLVELPPEAPEPTADAAPDTAGSGLLTDPNTTDKLWQELEKASQKPPTAPAATKTVEQIVREDAGPNLDQIQVQPHALPNASNADGTVNFEAVYQAADLPKSPFTAEQVLEMLAALPTELPLDTRRRTIQVSIDAMGKAIGATPENIVADASRKLAALAAYTDHLTQLTTEYVSTAEKKIAALQAQIEETGQSITAAQQKQARETQACTAECDRLDDVLEFFSLDVPPSKYAAPENKGNKPS